MTYGRNQIILSAWISVYNAGGNCRDWCAGITNDHVRRLFSEHRVNRLSDSWTYWRVGSADTARDIEYYLLNVLGFDGGTGGGDSSADQVYIYRKQPHTRP
jgi:hypothetical protein